MADVNLTIASGANISISLGTTSAPLTAEAVSTPLTVQQAIISTNVSAAAISVSVGRASSYINQYFYFTDGVNKVRRGVRDGYDVYDIELTSTGFDGVEDTDWKNKEKDPIS